MITFNQEAHTYTHNETGENYISVTTLLGKYKPFFDKDRHSTRVAQREGISKEMVLEMWQKENKRATTKGTKIHKAMERYILESGTEEEYKSLYDSYDAAVEEEIGAYRNVFTEMLLHDDNFKVAGTADLIFRHNKDFTLGDFKTNKKFNFTSNFGDYFKAPVEHLTYCEFNNYALQLSLYAYIYEKVSGLKCKKLVIFYLENGKWKPIHCNYLKSDIVNILDHFSHNLEQNS